MISVEYHADLKEVQSNVALARLLSAQEQSAPFDRLAWWQALADHCGLNPCLAVARQGADIAVLPLQTGDGEMAGLANWYTFRLRPVFSAGADRPRLMAALARSLAGKARRLTLGGLPDEDGSASLLERALRETGWIVSREPCDTNHVLEVNGRSYQEYLADRPGKLRTTLKRKTGKVEVTILETFDAGAWEEYEAIYRRSWKPEEGSPAFLRAFAMAEGASRRLRLGLARLDGQAIAAQMWTVEGSTAYIHKLAHIEEFRPLSPGSVLSAALFRHVIDGDRVAMVDFGTGDDGYKRDWMEQVRPRYRLDAMRPFAPRNWPVFAKSTLRRLAASRNRG